MSSEYVPKATSDPIAYQSSLYFSYNPAYDQIYEIYVENQNRVKPGQWVKAKKMHWEDWMELEQHRETKRLWKQKQNPTYKSRGLSFSRDPRQYFEKNKYIWEWQSVEDPDLYGSWSVFRTGPTVQQGRRIRIFEGPRLPDGSIPDASVIRSYDSMIYLKHKTKMDAAMDLYWAEKTRYNSMSPEEKRRQSQQEREELEQQLRYIENANRINRYQRTLEGERRGKESYPSPYGGGKSTRKNKKNKKTSRKNTRKY